MIREFLFEIFADKITFHAVNDFDFFPLLGEFFGEFVFNFNFGSVAIMQKIFGGSKNLFVEIFIRGDFYFPKINFGRDKNSVQNAVAEI